MNTIAGFSCRLKDVFPAYCPLQVQLGEARRELQELKAGLRVAHKEQKQLLLEKQARLNRVQAEPSWFERVHYNRSQSSASM